MKIHLAPAMAMLMTTAVLTGCFGSDSDSDDTPTDAGWTPNTTSEETCENVALGQTRRNSAPFLSLNTDIDFSQAFAVWKLAVEEGQELTANLQVPANKDYNMAFFSNLGVRLACADEGLLGENEEMTFSVVTGISTVWIKVWTASSPDNSAFTLRVNTPIQSVATPVDEVEPNDTYATAQVITEAHSLIRGGFDGGFEDDIFKFSVNAGDTVTVKGNANIPNESALVSISLHYSASEGILDNDNNDYLEDLDQGPSDFTFTVASGKNEFFVYLQSFGIGEAQSYEVEVQIEPAN